MRMMHKILIAVLLTFPVGAGLVLVPNVVSAASTLLYQQSDASYHGDTAASSFTQYLGTGLSGELSNVVLSASYAAAAGSSVVSMDLLECVSKGVSCVTLWGLSNDPVGAVFTVPAGGASVLNYNFSTTTTFTLNPSKYYSVALNHRTGTVHTVTPYGSSSASSWPGGQCEDGVGVFATLKDCYFYLGGVQTASNISSVSNLQPLTGSTTVSTSVVTSFDYNVYVGNSVSGYLMSFVDPTVGTSFALTGSVVPSGAGSVRRVVVLTSGHQYKLSVGLTDSTGGSYGGASTIFSVVATGTPLTVYTASTTIHYDPNGNVTMGTSSSATSSIYYQGTNFSLSGVFPAALDAALRTRFPFSYIYDAALLFTELGGGSATPVDAAFTFPLGAMTSTGSTTFTIINKSAIASIPAVAQIRDMMSYVIYFTTALYVIGAVMAAF